MGHSTVIGAKYQIGIPKELLNKVGLKVGDRIELGEGSDEIRGSFLTITKSSDFDYTISCAINGKVVLGRYAANGLDQNLSKVIMSILNEHLKGTVTEVAVITVYIDKTTKLDIENIAEVQAFKDSFMNKLAIITGIVDIKEHIALGVNMEGCA